MPYYLTYNVTPHPEGIEKEQIPPGDGACDAIIIVSIIEQPSVVSRAFIGVDGRTKLPLDEGDEFASWGVWASKLAEVLPEGSWQRQVAAAAHEACRGYILRGTSR